MRIAAFIPARGGSTRLPEKNLLEVNGRTLLQRAVDAAHRARLVAYVSTQDEKIAEHARQLGALVHDRPPHLGTATALVDDAVHHWYDKLGAYDLPDLIVMLNPTSPLRTHVHVEEALALMCANGADSVVSVTLGHEPHFGGSVGPDDVWRPTRDTSAPRVRTQDLGAMGHENGAIFGFTRAFWKRERRVSGGHVVAYPMHRWDSIDIDTRGDYEAARAIAVAREGVQHAYSGLATSSNVRAPVVR